MTPARIGFSYGGRDPGLAARLVPVVDYLEVAPDDLVHVGGDRTRLDPEVVAHVRDLATAVPLVVHGVGLSIGTATGASSIYLSLLDQLLEEVELAWHSEHLGYTTVDGHFLGTMLNVPRTGEALDVIAERVEHLMARYGLPFLLENVAHLLPDPGGPWSPAGFLNELVERTGCGVLLDVYNLECDAANVGHDIDAFLAELRLDAVAEIHVAGGVQEAGFQLDVHSRRPRPSTLDRAARARAAGSGTVGVADQLPDIAVTFEALPQAVPSIGADGVIEELARLRSRLDGRTATTAGSVP
jgi:uncharacterized protein (UPF0276 family)